MVSFMAVIRSTIDGQDGKAPRITAVLLRNQPTERFGAYPNARVF